MDNKVAQCSSPFSVGGSRCGNSSRLLLVVVLVSLKTFLTAS